MIYFHLFIIVMLMGCVSTRQSTTFQVSERYPSSNAELLKDFSYQDMLNTFHQTDERELATQLKHTREQQDAHVTTTASTQTMQRSEILPRCGQGQSVDAPIVKFKMNENDMQIPYPEIEQYDTSSEVKSYIDSWIRDEQKFFLDNTVCQRPYWQNELDAFFKFRFSELENQAEGFYNLKKYNPLSGNFLKLRWKGIPFKEESQPNADILFKSDDVTLRFEQSDKGILLTQERFTFKKFEEKLLVDQLFLDKQLRNSFLFYRNAEQIFMHRIGRPFAEDTSLFKNYPSLANKNKYNQKSIFNFKAKSFEFDQWSIIQVRGYQGDMSEDFESYKFSDVCFISKEEKAPTCLPKVVFISQGKNFSLLGQIRKGESTIDIFKFDTSKMSTKFEMITTIDRNLWRWNWIVTDNDQIFVLAPNLEKQTINLGEFKSNFFTKWVELSELHGSEIVDIKKMNAPNEYFVKTNAEEATVQIDFQTGQVKKTATQAALRSPSEIKTFQISVPNSENIEFWVKKRADLDLQQNDHKVVIFGYGGFQNTTPFSFLAYENFLVERGYIVIKTRLRGDGPENTNFRQSGRFLGKWNTISDIERVANWAIEKGWTRKKKIAFIGASNGGLVALLAAKKLNSLLAGVVSDVPVTDLSRVRNLNPSETHGPAWERTEYGTWPKSRDISPLHVMDENHASILLISGKDDRVVNWTHSLKMMNRLRELSGPSPSFLFATEQGLGHQSQHGFNYILLEYYIYSYLEFILR